MKLRALDQVHVSSVKPDSLRPGEEFEVSDETGKDLMKALPGKFSEVGVGGRAKARKPPANKAAPEPLNKAGSKKGAKGRR